MGVGFLGSEHWNLRGWIQSCVLCREMSGAASMSGCSRHSSLHLFWGELMDLPCGSDSARESLHQLGAVQMHHSLEFWAIHHLLEGEDIPETAAGRLLTRLGLLNDNTRQDMLPPVPRGALGSLIPKPQHQNRQRQPL